MPKPSFVSPRAPTLSAQSLVSIVILVLVVYFMRHALAQRSEPGLRLLWVAAFAVVRPSFSTLLVLRLRWCLSKAPVKLLPPDEARAQPLVCPFIFTLKTEDEAYERAAARMVEIAQKIRDGN